MRALGSPPRLALAARLACCATLLLAVLLPARPARAAVTFIARVDRAQLAFGERLFLEVTLSLDSGGANSYRAPDLRSFDLLLEIPSQSIVSGSGGLMRTAYSWRYELQPRKEGRLTIGPARVRVDGRELHTDSIAITVLPPGARGQPSGAQPAPRRGPRSPFDDFFGEGAPAPQQPAAGSFVRVVADKSKAYLGEPVTVEWFLYLAERQDNYRTIAEPRTDGFWAEDLAVGAAQGQPTLTQQTFEGRTYQVAPLMRKALFPLQAGKLTVTPLESEIAQVDLFGRALRTQRLKAEPLTIEAMELPTAGRPDGFDPGNVGRFTVEARLDRERVTVGEAVTLTFVMRGEGNLRKLAPPRLPPLGGWKMYEPKVDAKIDPNSGVTGSKTVEYLMLPERAGTTIVPAIELAYFDPETRTYGKQQSQPLRIQVVADGSATPRHGGPPGVGAVGGVENVLPTEIRPLRARPALQRDLGTTFYQSRLFGVALALPPFAFGLTVLVGRVREKLSKETERGRRRKTRKLVRQRLRAAEVHLEAGRAAAFTMEIDRVLREVLTARLDRPIAGLSRDELKALVDASGLGPQLAERINAELEECDRARFAPGSIGTGDMRASLERAAELIFLLEKAPMRPTVEARL